MDALNASNLEDTLLLEKKKSTATDEEWAKINRSAKKYLTKSVESRLQLKSKLYQF